MPRGNRQQKRGKLNWRNKQASHGRRGGQGKRKKFARWKEVRRKIRQNATVVITPPKEEREARKAAIKAGEADK